MATRLKDLYGIGHGVLSPLIAFAGTRYVLQLRWPPPQTPPRIRKGVASEYIVSEVQIAVAYVERPIAAQRARVRSRR